MKSSLLILLLSLLLPFLNANSADIRYVGGDISLFPKYKAEGAQYKDQNGNNIDLLPYLHELGMNAMRVRLFVEPDKFIASNLNADPNACQSLPYIIPLCKDIVDQGFDLMLDFHYSDTWADPGNQWIPVSWSGLTDEELNNAIYDYTKSTLKTLKENGIEPAFIQPGNEISYGMLWAPYGQDNKNNHIWEGSPEAEWKRFGSFLNSAIKACREECPKAQIIIHTERAAEVNVLTYFYDMMNKMNVDYDIIGLSYYPYFHGKMSVLNNALTTLETEYPDTPIMIVETGFPYAWEVQGSTQKVEYDYSYAGQDAFAHELVDTLLAHKNVNGLFWWWLEYNAYGTQLSGWYNAPLFDSRNGQATPALKTICSFGTGNADIERILDEKSIEDDRWFDINGRQISYPSKSGIYIHKGKKIIVVN